MTWNGMLGFRAARLLSVAPLVLAGTAVVAVPAEPPHHAVAARQQSCRAFDSTMTGLVRAVHDRQQNVGVAAALTIGGSVAFRTAIGRADIEQDVPITHETRFSIASITKLFTAVALLRLVEQGKVDLDAPIQTYVPTFPRKRATPITLRLLATHRSGMPHPNERTPELFATHYGNAREAVAFFQDVELLFEPGSDRRYSSSNYNLIAAALEAAANGTSFPELLRSEVLERIDASGTGFDNALRPLPRRTQRYSFYHPWTYAESDSLFVVPRWDYSFNYGGGNMYSTPTDLVRFAQALLNGDLLMPASLEILLSDAWFGSETGSGKREILATGANPGVQAGLLIRPAQDVAVAVLANTWGKGSRSGEMVVALPRALADRCLGE